MPKPPDKLPNRAVEVTFIDAFGAMVKRIEQSIMASATQVAGLPVRMYVAGGIAAHFYTASRMTDDVDAVFSHRMLLPEDLDVSYRDLDGRARLLYFDRQYNDTFGLMHEDAHRDSLPLAVAGVDPKVFEVRLLAPVDLAVSKIARFAAHDQEDIKSLAAHGLLNSRSLRKRAEDALSYYVGNSARVKTCIALICREIDVQTAKPRPNSAKTSRTAKARGIASGKRS